MAIRWRHQMVRFQTIRLAVWFAAYAPLYGGLLGGVGFLDCARNDKDKRDSRNEV